MKKYLSFAALFVVAAITTFIVTDPAVAQEVVDTATGNSVSEAIEVIRNALFALASIFITVAIGRMSTIAKQYLPSFLSGLIDQKHQADLHKAALTVVRAIILEGKDPADEMQRVFAHIYSSARDAVAHFIAQGRSAEEMRVTVQNIAMGKVVDVMADLELEKA